MISELIFESKVFARKILNLLSGKDKQLRKAAKLPTYTPGHFRWKNADIEFTDGGSFAFIFKELFVTHVYKFQTSKDKPLIIDCGANIGLSIMFFKEEFPNARIIAFEPEKDIFRILQKNIKAQNLSDVELIEKALWKNEEILSFSNEGADASRISSLHTGESFKSTYEVQAVRLSNYINEEVDFLKLDIEGAEVEVMKEIEPKLKFVKRIFIEYHSFVGNTQELDTLLAVLRRNNYRFYIDSPARINTMPFIETKSMFAFDFLLNIYATRTSGL